MLLVRLVNFRLNFYELIITDHARGRMVSRQISEDLLVQILGAGRMKPKPQNEAGYWVYAEVMARLDNLVCASVVIEGNSLVVKTVLINWRPK